MFINYPHHTISPFQNVKTHPTPNTLLHPVIPAARVGPHRAQTVLPRQHQRAAAPARQRAEPLPRVRHQAGQVHTGRTTEPRQTSLRAAQQLHRPRHARAQELQIVPGLGRGHTQTAAGRREGGPADQAGQGHVLHPAVTSGLSVAPPGQGHAAAVRRAG